MQKEQMESFKPKRIQKPSTPELSKRNAPDGTINGRPSSFRQRATMGPSEFSMPHVPTRRRLASDRVSMLPTQISLDNTRMSDTDCTDMELKLLYNEYLQTIMIEIISKKKAKEMEEQLTSQLATIAQECDRNEEMLFKLKTRERDIINLTKVQNDVDSQLMDVQNCTNAKDIKELESVLSQLNNLLKPLDVLRCKNIILPNTPEEWDELSKSLKSCSETLKSIMHLVGKNSESYQSVNNGIKEYMNTFKDIEIYHQRLEKDLCNLQALVLKTGSLSIMESHS